MTNEQILKKAIEKAEKNGFVYQKASKILIQEALIEIEAEDEVYFVTIFSHDFAKSFFGKGHTGGIPCKACGYNGCYELWFYHLQQMVVEKEPLLYLEKFL